MSGLEVYSHVESMHDRIMSLRGMENNNSLTPPLFIEVLVPKKKEMSGYVYVCYVFRVVFVSTILRLDCGFVLTVLYFLFCIFYYERT